MAKMFSVNGNSVEPTAEILLVPEFSKLWDSDTTTSKIKARTAFAYIYHSLDPNSLYVNYFDREGQARTDFFEGKELPKPIKIAFEKYKALITTPEQRLLEGSLSAADKLATYFGAIDFSEVDEKGGLVHDPHKLMASLQKVAGVMRSLKELRELMEKGQDEKESNRGNAKLNIFDESDD
jgi:hypothetical protein